MLLSKAAALRSQFARTRHYCLRSNSIGTLLPHTTNRTFRHLLCTSDSDTWVSYSGFRCHHNSRRLRHVLIGHRRKHAEWTQRAFVSAASSCGDRSETGRSVADGQPAVAMMVIPASPRSNLSRPPSPAAAMPPRTALTAYLYSLAREETDKKARHATRPFEWFSAPLASSNALPEGNPHTSSSSSCCSSGSSSSNGGSAFGNSEDRGQLKTSSKEEESAAAATTTTSSSGEEGSAKAELLRRLLMQHRDRTKNERSHGRGVSSSNSSSLTASSHSSSASRPAFSSKSATWSLAFQAFSDAMTSHGVFPTIQHINLLLAITLRQKQWARQDDVELFLVSMLQFVEEVKRADSDQRCQVVKDDPSKLSGSLQEEREENYDYQDDYQDAQQTLAPRGSKKKNKKRGLSSADSGVIDDVWTALQPNEHTHELFMAAAVERNHWMDAIEIFESMQSESLPISDVSLQLLLKAFSLANVRALTIPSAPVDAEEEKARSQQNPFRPSSTPLSNSRGGNLAAAASMRAPPLRDFPSSSSSSLSAGAALTLRKHSEEKYLWQVALTAFLPNRHRVKSATTLHLMISVLHSAGQDAIAVSVFEDCSRTIQPKTSTVLMALEAATQSESWCAALKMFSTRIAPLVSAPAPDAIPASRLLERGMGIQHDASLHPLSVLSDTAMPTATIRVLQSAALSVLQALWKAGMHKQIIEWFYQHCNASFSHVWTRKALLIVAHSAQLLLLVPLQLQLAASQPAEEIVSMGHKDDVPRSKPPHRLFPSVAATRTIEPVAQLYDIALTSVQLAAQNAASPRMRAGETSSSPLQKSATTTATTTTTPTTAAAATAEAENHAFHHRMDTLSSRLYAEYVLRASSANREPADRSKLHNHSLPHVGLLRYVILSRRNSRETKGEPAISKEQYWQRALQHLSYTARPDALAVALMTDVLRNEQRWEEALTLLHSVWQQDKIDRARQQKDEASAKNGGACALLYSPAATSIAALHVIDSARDVPFAALQSIQTFASSGLISRETASEAMKRVYDHLVSTDAVKSVRSASSSAQQQQQLVRNASKTNNDSNAKSFLSVEAMDADEADNGNGKDYITITSSTEVVGPLVLLLRYFTEQLQMREDGQRGAAAAAAVAAAPYTSIEAVRLDGTSYIGADDLLPEQLVVRATAMTDRDMQCTIDLLRHAIALLQQLRGGGPRSSQSSCVPFYALVNHVKAYLNNEEDPFTSRKAAQTTANKMPKVSEASFRNVAAVAVTNAILYQVSVTDVSRWTLWEACLDLIISTLSSPSGNGESQATQATFKTLTQFIRRCDRAESGFVEGVVLKWVLGGSVSPSRLSVSAARLALEGVVWAARRRERDLSRVLLGAARGSVKRTLEDAAPALPVLSAMDVEELSNDYTQALCVVAQCLTSGDHERVVRDWREIMDVLLELVIRSRAEAEAVSERGSSVAATSSRAAEHSSMIMDVVAAVAHDKQRRTLIYLLKKRVFDDYRIAQTARKSSENASPTPRALAGSLLTDHAEEFAQFCETQTTLIKDHLIAQYIDSTVLSATSIATAHELLRSAYRLLACVWDAAAALTTEVRVRFQVFKSSFPSESNFPPLSPERCVEQLERMVRCICLFTILATVEKQILSRGDVGAQTANANTRCFDDSVLYSWLDTWLIATADMCENRRGATSDTKDDLFPQRVVATALRNVTSMDSMDAQFGRWHGEHEGRFILRVIDSIVELSNRFYDRCVAPDSSTITSTSEHTPEEKKPSSGEHPPTVDMTTVLHAFNESQPVPVSVRGLMLLQSMLVPLMHIALCESELLMLHDSLRASSYSHLSSSDESRHVSNTVWRRRAVHALALYNPILERVLLQAPMKVVHGEQSSEAALSRPVEQCKAMYAAVIAFLGESDAEAYASIVDVNILIARHNTCAVAALHTNSATKDSRSGKVTIETCAHLRSSAIPLLFLTAQQSFVQKVATAPDAIVSTVLALRPRDLQALTPSPQATPWPTFSARPTSGAARKQQQKLQHQQQRPAALQLVISFVVKCMLAFPLAPRALAADDSISTSGAVVSIHRSRTALLHMMKKPNTLQQRVLIDLCTHAAKKRPRLFSESVVQTWVNTSSDAAGIEMPQCIPEAKEAEPSAEQRRHEESVQKEKEREKEAAISNGDRALSEVQHRRDESKAIAEFLHRVLSSSSSSSSSPAPLANVTQSPLGWETLQSILDEGCGASLYASRVSMVPNVIPLLLTLQRIFKKSTESDASRTVERCRQALQEECRAFFQWCGVDNESAGSNVQAKRCETWQDILFTLREPRFVGFMTAKRDAVSFGVGSSEETLDAMFAAFEAFTTNVFESNFIECNDVALVVYVVAQALVTGVNASVASVSTRAGLWKVENVLLEAMRERLLPIAGHTSPMSESTSSLVLRQNTLVLLKRFLMYVQEWIIIDQRCRRLGGLQNDSSGEVADLIGSSQSWVQVSLAISVLAAQLELNAPPSEQTVRSGGRKTSSAEVRTTSVEVLRVVQHASECLVAACRAMRRNSTDSTAVTSLSSPATSGSAARYEENLLATLQLFSVAVYLTGAWRELAQILQVAANLLISGKNATSKLRMRLLLMLLASTLRTQTSVSQQVVDITTQLPFHELCEFMEDTCGSWSNIMMATSGNVTLKSSQQTQHGASDSRRRIIEEWETLINEVRRCMMLKVQQLPRYSFPTSHGFLSSSSSSSPLTYMRVVLQVHPLQVVKECISRHAIASCQSGKTHDDATVLRMAGRMTALDDYLPFGPSAANCRASSMAVSAEGEHNEVAPQLSDRNAPDSSTPTISWQDALRHLSAVPPHMYFRLSSLKSASSNSSTIPTTRQTKKRSKALQVAEESSRLSALQRVEENLLAAQESAWNGRMPWQTALLVFGTNRLCRLPHTTSVVHPRTSELLINVCPTWEQAMQMVKHSCSTLHRPTRVPQLLAELALRRIRLDASWKSREVSWEAALFLYDCLQDGRIDKRSVASSTHTVPRTPMAIPQQCMHEILRHCVFHAPAMCIAYAAYQKQNYTEIRGAHVYLSLLRCARLCDAGELALEAMYAFAKHSGAPLDRPHAQRSERTSDTAVSCTISEEGIRQIWASFVEAYRAGVVELKAVREISTSLHRAGIIGEVEEAMIDTIDATV